MTIEECANQDGNFLSNKLIFSTGIKSISIFPVINILILLFSEEKEAPLKNMNKKEKIIENIKTNKSK